MCIKNDVMCSVVMSGISLKCEDINIYCKTNKTLESLEDFAKMFFHHCWLENGKEEKK